MVCFPNCKINLGLAVVNRREDGYHNIETAMYPIKWCDVLEIVPAKGSVTTLTTYGRKVECPPEKNLVMKAYNALKAEISMLPPVDIYLEKVIPDGAGLGGGSSDAAFALTTLNEMFSLGLSRGKLATIAAKIGADCPFFIYNEPSLCTGIGADIEPIDLSILSSYSILIVKPKVAAVSTAAAYAAITPKQPQCPIVDTLSQPIKSWRERLVNDFEKPIFAALPELQEIKQTLYDSGAIYAAMSGSGAALFAIFDSANLSRQVGDKLSHCDIFVQ